MKRMIIAGFSLLALTAVGIEAIATPVVSSTTVATRHRDSSLPNPHNFDEAMQTVEERTSELSSPYRAGVEPAATRHRDSEQPNPHSFEEAMESIHQRDDSAPGVFRSDNLSPSTRHRDSDQPNPVFGNDLG